MKNKGLAIVGTASNVGKSSIAAAIMRYYANKGVDVTPFKALNVTSNIGESKEGLKMAVSQIKQAQACNKEASVLYNPILINPTSTKMQMYLNGKEIECNYDSNLLDGCVDSYFKLNKVSDLVVIEGSGSCAELNLKEKDLANFPLLKRIKVPVILVANIENCGIFASVYGTLELLEKEERDLIKGIIINKYCGDVNYFNEAKEIIENLTKLPVLGVIPLDEKSKTFEEMWNNVYNNIDMTKLTTIIEEVI